MWDPPRPGLEPVSPALAGRFSTTAPPGKPFSFFTVEVLKLGDMSPQILFFFFKIVYAVLGTLNFHINFSISSSISAKKKPAEILIETALNL